MIFTLNISKGNIVGIVGSRNYSIKYSKETYLKLKVLSDRYELCESFEEAKAIISESDEIIEQLESVSVGEYLAYSKTGKLYLKGGDTLSPFPVPDNIAKLMFEYIEKGKDINPLIKFMLRLYNNIYLCNSNMHFINEIFDLYEDVVDAQNMSVAKRKKNNLGITESGLFVNACNSYDFERSPFGWNPSLYLDRSGSSCISPEWLSPYNKIYVATKALKAKSGGSSIITTDKFLDFELSRGLVEQVLNRANKYMGSGDRLISKNLGLILPEDHNISNIKNGVCKKSVMIYHKTNGFTRCIFKVRKNEVVNLLKQKTLGDE